MAPIKRPGGPAAKPTAAPKSKYAGTTSTAASRDSNYFSAGRYIAMIERCEGGENQAGAPIIAVNQTILVSDPSTRGPLDEKSGPAKRVGESATDLFSKKNVSFAANFMAFAVTVSGMAQEDIRHAEMQPDEAGNPGYDGRFVEEILGDDQPFAGVVVELNVKVVPTKAAKNSGKPLMEIPLGKDGLFTKVSYVRTVPFSELPELVDAKVLARFIPDLDEKIAEENSPPVE